MLKNNDRKPGKLENGIVQTIQKNGDVFRPCQGFAKRLKYTNYAFLLSINKQATKINAEFNEQKLLGNSFDSTKTSYDENYSTPAN